MQGSHLKTKKVDSCDITVASQAIVKLLWHLNIIEYIFFMNIKWYIIHKYYIKSKNIDPPTPLVFGNSAYEEVSQ